MKLTCVKCGAAIGQAHVNLREGIAQCPSCEEVFRVADHLRSDETVRRIQKPSFSKIDYRKQGHEHVFTIPPSGWSTTTLFFLLFTTGWNAISWTFLFLDHESKLFLVPFLIIGVVTAGLFFFNLLGTNTVRVDKQRISVRWSVLSLSYAKTRQVVGLETITEDVIYRQNYQPVYGIGLFFTSEGNVKFGSSLKEEERKWMIGELYEITGAHLRNQG